MQICDKVWVMIVIMQHWFCKYLKIVDVTFKLYWSVVKLTSNQHQSETKCVGNLICNYTKWFVRQGSTFSIIQGLAKARIQTFAKT